MTTVRNVRRNTVLAALASYIDAGSIVAGAAGLALWADEFGLGSSTIGLIGAFSSNAISAGVGALAGGWLCDRLGRRRVYQWDLLVYAFGLVWIIFATEPWMLITGYVFAGLAVGADVPASWTLIAETAPARKRGRYGGTAQLLWSLGPLVVLLMALALSGLGLLGIRIIFAHLLVVSHVLWALRRRMHESPMWESAKARSSARLADVRLLLSRAYLAPLLFLTGMYGFWNLKAGTSGFFLPYILRTAGNQSQAASVAFSAVGFVLGSFGIVFVFMRLVDRTNQRRLFLTSVGLQVSAMLLFALFPLTTVVAIVYVLLNGVGGGFGPQAFFQLWSAELFPTALRASALGLMFAVVRIALGIWSLYVPAITAAGFHTLAWLLTGFLLVSGVLGFAFAPSNPGRSLAELQPESATDVETPVLVGAR
jgi:inositol transporter-like SP family MFS transporter